MKPVECKKCQEKITQLPTGTWIDGLGVVFCLRQPNGTPLEEFGLHEPIIDPEWADRIRSLAKYSPSHWTPGEIAKLMQLAETQVKNILEDT
jgi:hypothetical protein